MVLLRRRLGLGTPPGASPLQLTSASETDVLRPAGAPPFQLTSDDAGASPFQLTSDIATNASSSSSPCPSTLCTFSPLVISCTLTSPAFTPFASAPLIVERGRSRGLAPGGEECAMRRVFKCVYKRTRTRTRTARSTTGMSTQPGNEWPGQGVGPASVHRHPGTL